MLCILKQLSDRVALGPSYVLQYGWRSADKTIYGKWVDDIRALLIRNLSITYWFVCFCVKLGDHWGLFALNGIAIGRCVSRECRIIRWFIVYRHRKLLSEARTWACHISSTFIKKVNVSQIVSHYLWNSMTSYPDPRQDKTKICTTWGHAHSTRIFRSR